MYDPLEGMTPLGTITTGARPDRLAAEFRPVLAAAIELVRSADPGTSLYVYGSVATGMAQRPTSDVDLLSIGLASDVAAEISADLSGRFAAISRAVEIGPAQRTDFSSDTDEGYGGCVFLKHYCVHLTGADLHSELPDFPADTRAARGFNGDIAIHAARWRSDLESGADPGTLARRLARKTLLAVAGLVSIHDETWTTDRNRGAARWAEIEPSLKAGLNTLVIWSAGDGEPDRNEVGAVLDAVVARVASSFEESIGLWGPSEAR